MTLTQIGKATRKDPRDAVIDLVIADHGESSVFVNGKRVVADGVMTSERPGRPLRGPGYQSVGNAQPAKLAKRDESLRPSHASRSTTGG